MSARVVENIPKTKICRLCMAHTKVYFNITQNKKLSKMLKALTAIEVKEVLSILFEIIAF